MPRVRFAACLLLSGCTIGPLLLGEPPAGHVIVGGLGDVRPYFGTLRVLGGLPVGDLMLATCGCGDWRVFMTAFGATQQWQFPVRFYSSQPEYDPDEDVSVFGGEEEAVLSGLLSQTGGLFAGRTRRGASQFWFDAQRGETHNDPGACVRCHIGDNPIWPQPENHPRFELNPPNCLTCHQVLIDGVSR